MPTLFIKALRFTFWSFAFLVSVYAALCVLVFGIAFLAKAVS